MLANIDSTLGRFFVFAGRMIASVGKLLDQPTDSPTPGFVFPTVFRVNLQPKSRFACVPENKSNTNNPFVSTPNVIWLTSHFLHDKNDLN